VADRRQQGPVGGQYQPLSLDRIGRIHETSLRVLEVDEEDLPINEFYAARSNTSKHVMNRAPAYDSAFGDSSTSFTIL